MAQAWAMQNTKCLVFFSLPPPPPTQFRWNNVFSENINTIPRCLFLYYSSNIFSDHSSYRRAIGSAHVELNPA